MENAIRDPSMAQVTLCGVFIIYNKVEEPAEPKPEVSTPEESTTPATPEVTGVATGETAAADSEEKKSNEPSVAAGETMETEDATDMPDDPALDPESPPAKSEEESK